MAAADLRAQVRGCLGGCYAGDVLGAPFEGESAASVRKACMALGLPGGPVDIVDRRRLPDTVAAAEVVGIDLLQEQPDCRGHYTDDTECMLALAESLVVLLREHVDVDDTHVAMSTTLWFARPPSRGGYSGQTFRKLETLTQSFQQAGDYAACRQAVRNIEVSEKEERSWGNGAPMRIAILGLAFRRGWEDIKLMRDRVTRAVGFTHNHEEAIDGATIVALAAARLASAAAERQPLDPLLFLRWLTDACTTSELQGRLNAVCEHIAAVRQSSRSSAGEGSGSSDAASMTAQAEDVDEYFPEDRAFLQQICTAGKWFQIRAVDAVTYVLFVLCKYGDLDGQRHGAPTVAMSSAVRTVAEEVVVRVIALGGDADTLAAIAGALVGCLYGYSWIPRRWLDMFEQSEVYGWQRAMSLADELSEAVQKFEMRAKEEPLGKPDAAPKPMADCARMQEALRDHLSRVLVPSPTICAPLLQTS